MLDIKYIRENADLVRRAVTNKNESADIDKIIELDQKETRNIRTILNFGHTVGHAIEGATGLEYAHGEAISVDMICESEIAHGLNMISKNEADEIENIIP